MIEKNLKNGAYVVVKGKNERYQVFSPHKDGYGYYRCSGWFRLSDNAKRFIGCISGYVANLDELAKEENWEVVEIFYGQQPTFKEGDRVQVADTADDRYRGGIFEVHTVCDDDFIACNDGKADYVFKKTNLAHAESEEVEEMTMEEVCKALGKIIKIKK